MRGRHFRRPHLEQVYRVAVSSELKCAFGAGQPGADDFDSSGRDIQYLRRSVAAMEYCWDLAMLAVAKAAAV